MKLLLLLLLSVISIVHGAPEPQPDAGRAAAAETFQKFLDLRRLDQYDEDNDETLTFNEWVSVQPSRMSLQPDYVHDEEFIELQQFHLCNEDGSIGLEWKEVSNCIDKYQGKLHGFLYEIVTKEEFDKYDEDNNEILTINEWMSVQPSRIRLQPDDDVDDKRYMELEQFYLCDEDGSIGLEWKEISDCIDKYQGKLHGLIIITMTKEEFDQYDKDNDEILTFNEWMSADA